MTRKQRTPRLNRYCSRCGDQDERTKAGKIVCAACAEKAKETVKDSCKALYWERRNEGLCVRCGTEDARTASGMICCEACSQYKIRHKKRLEARR